MQPLRVGIIGCGVVAPTHIESYLKQDGVRIAWACDLVESKAQGLAETYSIERVTTRYTDVLADDTLDCISICTDHASHAEIAAAALQAGVHVLCEKALAANQDQLRLMFEAHQANPGPIFSGIFQHRFTPSNRYMKELIETGGLGQLITAGVQIRCRRTPEYYLGDEWRGTWAREGGSVLINQAIHFIDLLAWISGGVEAVCGTYANLTHGDSMETEDTATAALRLRCGAAATLEATCSSHLGWENSLAFHGTEGSIELRGERPMKLAFVDDKRREKVEQELQACREGPGVKASRSHYGTGHLAQIADFIEAVRDGREPYVPASSARHTVDLVLGVYESHRTGKWVSLG